MVLVLVAPPSGSPPSLQGVLTSGFGRPVLNLSVLLGEIEHLEPVAILEMGTLFLVATPIVRVAVSVILFLEERDLAYVGITALVLTMLLVAIFVIGPLEG